MAGGSDGLYAGLTVPWPVAAWWLAAGGTEGGGGRGGGWRGAGAVGLSSWEDKGWINDAIVLH